jgi:uncharacterized protein (DUF2336 family)
MVFEQFLQRTQSAPLEARCRATAALVRSYLNGHADPHEREEMEAVMTLLLDDPAPEIQIELARALAPEKGAPRHVILALVDASDAVSSLILQHSPVLIEAELVEFIAEGTVSAQCAIAARAWLPPALSAALAEVGECDALVVLAENLTASVPDFSLAKMAERYGHDGRLREAMLVRAHLPLEVRHQLMTALSKSLADLAIGRNWMRADRATTASEEAKDKSTVQMAAAASTTELPEFVEHLRATGQLTTTLLLRAATHGNVRFLMEALSVLSGLPRRRVESLIVDGRDSACRALFDKAGLPQRVFPAFLAALDVQRELATEMGLQMPSHAEHHRFASRVVERVLTKCAAHSSDEQRDLIVLLRRFATEAQRDAARMLAAALGQRPRLLLAAPEFDDIATPALPPDLEPIVAMPPEAAPLDLAFEHVAYEHGFEPEFGEAFAVDVSPADHWSAGPLIDEAAFAGLFETAPHFSPEPALRAA